MGLPHRRQVVLHDRDGVVPLARPEVEERDLRQRPEAESRNAERLREIDHLRIERALSVEVAEVAQQRCVVAERAEGLAGVDRERDEIRPLEIGKPATVADARTGCTDVGERVGLEIPEVELLRERERLPTGLDRLRIPAREHQEPRRLGVELRLGKRGSSVGEQRPSVREPRERGIVPAGQPVGLGEK